MNYGYQEKIYNIAEKLNQKFQMAPLGAEIQIWAVSIDFPNLSYDDVQLVINKFSDEYKIIEKTQDWEWVSGKDSSNVYCKIKKLDNFDEEFIKIIKKFRQHIKIFKESNKDVKIDYSEGTLLEHFKYKFKSILDKIRSFIKLFWKKHWKWLIMFAITLIGLYIGYLQLIK